MENYYLLFSCLSCQEAVTEHKLSQIKKKNDLFAHCWFIKWLSRVLLSTLPVIVFFLCWHTAIKWPHSGLGLSTLLYVKTSRNMYWTKNNLSSRIVSVLSYCQLFLFARVLWYELLTGLVQVRLACTCKNIYLSYVSYLSIGFLFIFALIF